MGSDIFQLKEEIKDAYPGDEPPWKAFGRIKLKTGIDLQEVSAGDELPDDDYEAVRQAAEEVTGESISG